MQQQCTQQQRNNGKKVTLCQEEKWCNIKSRCKSVTHIQLYSSLTTRIKLYVGLSFKQYNFGCTICVQHVDWVYQLMRAKSDLSKFYLILSYLFHILIILSGLFCQIVKLLFEYGEKINATDDMENTPLHYCCLSGNAAHALFLLQVSFEHLKFLITSLETGS